MDLVNPSLNPPALQPTISIKRFSQHSRGHSRSPSHSPVRPYSPLSLDPLLRSLSPTATLYAFTPSRAQSQHDSRSPSPRRRDLKVSFSKVSDDQRDLGTRAAQACLDIRSWARELAAWHWPGVFEEPEPARKKARVSMMSIGSLASAMTNGTTDADADDGQHQYLGCLPFNTVREYDQRCQEVASGLDEIEMNELKDFALQAHQRADQSIDGRLDGQHSPPNQQDLDDFTAIITATVLQTLPYLNQLNRLLDTWTVRLAILKQIPNFLDELERLKRDLGHGWAAIAVSWRKNGDAATLQESNMQDMQRLIDARMTALGSTLDGFLDMLEGQDDTVPDSFMDKFEELEQQYAEWVVTAQQRVLGDELKAFDQDISSSNPPTAIRLNGNSIDRAKTPTLRDIERARTPTAFDADGLSSPVFHEIERAKTPVIHDVDRAKTPTFDSFVAPVGLVADVSRNSSLTDVEPDQDDLTRETQKSRLLRTLHESGSDGQHVIPTDESPDATSLDRHVAINSLALSKQITPVHHEPEQTYSSTGSSSTPYSGQPSTEDSDLSASPDTILPAHEASGAVKSRKGSILRRLFKRDKSPEPKRHSSTTSNASERPTRRDRSDGIIRAVGRSLSRKRAPKPEKPPFFDERVSNPISPEHEHRSNTAFDSADANHESLQIERPSTMHHLEREKSDESLSRRARPATVGAHGAGFEPPTYQPKGMTGRPASGHFSENWPLSAEASATQLDRLSADHTQQDGEEDVPEELNVRTVRSMAAIDSDNFLDVFIGGFPAAPTSPIVEKPKQADLAWAQLQEAHEPEVEANTQTPVRSRWSAETDEMDNSTLTAIPPLTDSRVRVPVVTSSMLSSDGRQDNLSVARAISIDRLRQFERPVSYSDKEVSVSHSTDHLGSSLPIPVIMDDTDTHLVVADQATMLDSGSSTDQHLQPTGTMSTAPYQTESDTGVQKSSYAHEQTVATPQEMPAEENQKVLIYPPKYSRQLSLDTTDDESGLETRNRLKRASTASIKAHAISEVRSIDVPPRKRDSSKLVHSQLSPELQSPAADSTPGSRRSSITYFNRSGYNSAGGLRSGTQSPTGSMDTPNFSRLRSSSVDTDDNRAPLAIAVAKRRLREAPGLATISPSGDHSEAAADDVPKPTATKVVPADNFDRHVSEVLESLPAPIRFRNRAGDDISTASPARSAATKTTRSRNAPTQRQTSAIGLTLAPAEATPRRAAPTDPEIKLYHLTQAGREEPIKLFVRLVGDGERVMVRVGGGWSDLADFLRQYAEHHGSRTVSGSISGLELQTASNSPAGSRRTSGVVPTLAEKRGRPASREGEPATPVKPAVATLSKPVSVIEGIAELPGSLPPSSQSPTAASLGKQNSKLRRKGSGDVLSDQKARWVTRMLDKARRETAPAKNNSKDGTFGTMGRVGSTRRVFFSSPSSKAAAREERNSTKR